MLAKADIIILGLQKSGLGKPERLVCLPNVRSKTPLVRRAQ